MNKYGLTIEEAKEKLEKYGKNEIKRKNKISPLKIFISQFTSPLIIILVLAAIISWAIGFLPGQKSDIVDTILILLIVFASGIAGFMQDYKAEKSVESLKRMSSPKAKVIRSGKEMEIDAKELVPGDLIILEAGDRIPADAKIVDSFNLEVDESILTGESKAVKKKNYQEVFMNTFVYSGNAKAVVTKTGMHAKIGEIAAKLQEIKEEETPFQKELAKFGKRIVVVIIGIIVIMLIIGLFKYSWYQSLLTAISLAVAAIPEGLPAVVTLSLAIGAKSMVKKNCLVRKLAVTESVGAVDIICTDKTGTITKNEMVVSKIFFNDEVFKPEKLSHEEIEKLKPLFMCGALCNSSRIGYTVEGNRTYIGDQTEIAIRKLADELGFVRETLQRNYKKVDEIPFTSERKMMSVVLKNKDSKYSVYSKGAPEILIEFCNRVQLNGKILKLDENLKNKILSRDKEFASHGLRVLGFAYKEMKNPKEEVERDLIWLGLQAMIDPPRNEVKKALKDCKTAGIRVIMLTGDNPLTAKSIAEEINLKSEGILVGKELDSLSDEELKKKLDEGINIFARISPFHKLRILEILRKDNRVAMTGDGINDTLAIKRADVGIAMEVRGTDVAKEASDMVLLDDNFATITESIKEGRRIFDNIRKFVNYLFVCNFAEVAVLFLATLFLNLKDPIMLPAQLLWINLLTDGFPALALGVDPPRPDIMLKKPRRKNEPIINKRLWWMIGTIGSKKTLVLFGTFFIVLPFGVGVARTTLFTGFILYEFVRIGTIRYQEKLSWLANKWLLLALFGSVLLQLVIIYTPLNKFFHIVPLGLYPWLILIGGVTIGYFTAIGITKLILKYVKE